jgi:hypothetical protein
LGRELILGVRRPSPQWIEVMDAGNPRTATQISPTLCEFHQFIQAQLAEMNRILLFLFSFQLWHE